MLERLLAARSVSIIGSKSDENNQDKDPDIQTG
jgi:hypothetical protein